MSKKYSKLILFFFILISLNAKAGPEAVCPEYKIDYFPYSFTIEAKLSPATFDKVSTCSFDFSSCEMNQFFVLNNLEKSAEAPDIRIRIIDKKNSEIRYVTAQKNILVDSVVYKIPKGSYADLIDGVVNAGDTCTAKKRYDRMCMGNGQSKNLKSLCASLKKGELKGGVHVEVPSN